MKVYRNDGYKADEFPIVMRLTAGDTFPTVRAAKDLRDRLSSVLAEIKKEAKE